MLVYVATVAISAFFVPHYLSVFWEPLRENPWDIVGGAVVVVILVADQHRRHPGGGQVNILLAVVDFATQALLVAVGFVLVFSPEILKANIHWGVAPTWSDFCHRHPGRDAGLHGGRDRLQPRRGGARPARGTSPTPTS